MSHSLLPEQRERLCAAQRTIHARFDATVNARHTLAALDAEPFLSMRGHERAAGIAADLAREFTQIAGRWRETQLHPGAVEQYVHAAEDYRQHAVRHALAATDTGVAA